MLGEGMRSTNSSTPAKGTERKREEKLNYESLKGGSFQFLFTVN